VQQEDAALDFGGKKKKKVVFDDHINEKLEARSDGEVGGEIRQRHSRREIIEQPWDGAALRIPCHSYAC
jgi:hypothetical protein